MFLGFPNQGDGFEIRGIERRGCFVALREMYKRLMANVVIVSWIEVDEFKIHILYE